MDRVRVLPKLPVSKTGTPSGGRVEPWPLDIEISDGAKFVTGDGEESCGVIEHGGRVVARLRTSTLWQLVRLKES